MIQLTPIQQTILDVVNSYPGQFSRSGLAKMLVGAKSWQEGGYPEYGRLAGHGRKSITYDIDVLVQQGVLGLDGWQKLIPAA
ncbi:MAG: hypothetical protein KC415_18085 [Anaerolineales bacterium]|nr:hypothetical protein [Anaerolineales bacterium]